MNLNLFRWQSLKTRMTLFTLVIFVASIWALDFFASRMLREDMQRVLGEQQFSMVSIVAAEINDQLDDRFSALREISKQINPAMMSKPEGVQALLEQRPILQILFNGSVIALDLDGTAIADPQRAAGRIGVNFMDRDFISGAVREGKATIGKPVMDKVLQTPIFVMAIPLRDTEGKVFGALAGATHLGKPNFLDRVTKHSESKAGDYLLLVDAKHRLIVTSSVKSRIMEMLPAPGGNPMLDKYVQGHEGSGVVVNPLGVEVLTSARAIPAADWYLRAALPTETAFAPVRAMQHRMLLATAFLTLFAGGLIWLMVRRQLSPMISAATTLAVFSATNQKPRPLPITSRDEIGDLVGGFNRLLEALAQREEELNRTNADLRRFAEVTAHHLQEPARRMGSYADRLTQQLGDRIEDAETRMSLEFIGQQARRQQNLLRDVERYLAADQARGEIRAQDVGKTIARILTNLADCIEETGAEVVRGDLQSPWIDAPRLEDLFFVVLDNALRHGVGTQPLRITIEGQRQTNRVRYSISDNGPGIEEKYRERVFQIFERLSASHGDTGIGLSILRRIAESCGGHAWIEEAPGGGCRVVFDLPAEEPHRP